MNQSGSSTQARAGIVNHNCARDGNRYTTLSQSKQAFSRSTQPRLQCRACALATLVSQLNIIHMTPKTYLLGEILRRAENVTPNSNPSSSSASQERLCSVHASENSL